MTRVSLVLFSSYHILLSTTQYIHTHNHTHVAHICCPVCRCESLQTNRNRYLVAKQPPARQTNDGYIKLALRVRSPNMRFCWNFVFRILIANTRELAASLAVVFFLHTHVLRFPCAFIKYSINVTRAHVMCCRCACPNSSKA